MVNGPSMGEAETDRSKLFLNNNIKNEPSLPFPLFPNEQRINLPQALQMVWPLPARRHKGVVVVPQLAQLVAVTPTLTPSFLAPLTEFFRTRGETDRVDDDGSSEDPWGCNLGEGVGVTDIPPSECLDNEDPRTSPKGESGEANLFRLPERRLLLLLLFGTLEGVVVTAAFDTEEKDDRHIDTSSISLS